MTEVAQTYLGNIHQQPDLADLVDRSNYLEVSLQPSDRTKGRIHAYTAKGVSIGIIKSRDRLIESGDVFQTQSQQLVVVLLPEEELLVLDFSQVAKNVAPVQLVYLGHLLGNHHYPIAIKENRIYVKVVTSSQVLERLLQEIAIPGLKINYQTGVQSEPNITFATHSH